MTYHQTINSDALPTGTEVCHGLYRIETFLSSGGWGKIYLARNSLDQTIVLKECYPEAFCRRDGTNVVATDAKSERVVKAAIQNFVLEAQNLANLVHPQIVAVHQIFKDMNTGFIAMDFIEGTELQSYIDDGNRMPPETFRVFYERMLDCLVYLHDQGMVHRDIAPDNIILRTIDEPVLIDFGAAHKVDRTDVGVGMRVAKDGYSPIEFYSKEMETGFQSDIYSLAATLYFAATGMAPPNAKDRARAIKDGQPDPYRSLADLAAGTLPETMVRGVDQALAFAPADRFASAQQWWDSAVGAAAPERVIAEPTPVVEPEPVAVQPEPTPAPAQVTQLQPEKKSSGKTFALLATAATAVGALGAGYAFMSSGNADQTATAMTVEAPVAQPTTVAATQPEAPSPEPMKTATAETVSPPPVAPVVATVAAPAVVAETPKVEVAAAASAPTEAILLPKPRPADLIVASSTPPVVTEAVEPVQYVTVMAADPSAATIQADQSPEVVIAAAARVPNQPSDSPAGVIVAPAEMTPVVATLDLGAAMRPGATQPVTVVAPVESLPVTRARPTQIAFASDIPALPQVSERSTPRPDQFKARYWSDVTPFNLTMGLSNSGQTVLKVQSVHHNVAGQGVLVPGATVLRINGQDVRNTADVQRLMAAARASAHGGVAEMHMTVSNGSAMKSGSIQFADDYHVTFANGLELMAQYVGGGWEFTVENAPVGSALRSGDRLDSIGSAKLTSPAQLEEVVASMISSETSKIDFVAHRSDKMIGATVELAMF